MRQTLPGDPALYREIEHTADRGIIVQAATPAALFEKAALSLYAIMVRSAGVEAREERIARAEAEDWEDLLHHWLTEVLAIFSTDWFVAAEVTVDAIGPTSVRGTLRGERFDPARHEFESEVKAVTYHALEVTTSHGRWQASVIFDV